MERVSKKKRVEEKTTGDSLVSGKPKGPKDRDTKKVSVQGKQHQAMPESRLRAELEGPRVEESK